MKKAFVTLAPLLAVGVAVGCGSSNPKLAAPARPQDFPASPGQSVKTLIANLPTGAIAASSVSVLRVGQNRVAFGLFSPDRKQITNAQIALYTADAVGQHLAGPYLAHEESLRVAPQFQSQTVASDPNAANSVYVAQVPFQRPGRQEVVALARIGGRLLFANGFSDGVGAPGGPPDVGQRAISVHTPTVGQVGRANVSTIDTRTPPALDLQQEDFANVLGRKPVVLLFATPQLCSSRVCGPVTDIAEQVRSETGSAVSFVHMEIYNANTVSKGYRPQVTAWRLPTEPWLFVIDRHGRITTRIEGAFSVDELRAAVKQVR